MWRKLLVLLLSMLPVAAEAQFYATCRSGEISELDASIQAHQQHNVRLHHKFVTGWYLQGKLPETFRPILRTEIVTALANLGSRRAAVLFQAYQDGRFCSWLISPHIGLVAHQTALSEGDLRRLQPRLIAAMGVEGAARGVAPVRKRGPVAEMGEGIGDDRDVAAPWLAVLHELGETFLPPPIRQSLLREHIDTLIVVPVFEAGTIPFSALPVDETRSLVDVASVVVAPGLFVFQRPPYTARTAFPRALIVGNPSGWTDPDWIFAPLPGAEREVRELARITDSTPLIGTAATAASMQRVLRTKPTLIYLATHGVADPHNPLDEGFLLLSNGRLTAKSIAKSPLGATHPLVVMSACQSGLGKTFDVGTIGLARAWHQAGASNVVMSLWNVGDASTAQLMSGFIAALPGIPPDRALREAMLAQRKIDPKPSNWASFAVFGLPERSATE